MSEEIKSSTNENFEELLNQQFDEVEKNESGRIVGTVELITPTEVFVSVVGRKQQGVIPLDELSTAPISDPNEVVKVGDQLDLLIMKTNDVEGTIMLSKKRVDAKKGLQVLQEACQNKEILTGKVSNVVNGGLIVVLNNVRVFIPASQVSLQKDVNLDEYVGQEVQFRLIEVSQRGRQTKVIGSIKNVLREESNAARNAFWEGAEVGNTYTGVVKTVTDFGVFVDLGGVTGMIHRSELSWHRIKHPSEVLNEGDIVEVYIKGLDKEKKKISLGYKKEEDNPWKILVEKYPEGSVVDVKIVNLPAFGAFANIIDGIDGLIHISQISYDHIANPADVLKIGEVVKAKITAIDTEKKKVSLSIKALLPEPEKPAPIQEKDVEDTISTQDEVVCSIDADGTVDIAESLVVSEDEVPVAEPKAVEALEVEEKVEETLEDVPVEEPDLTPSEE